MLKKTLIILLSILLALALFGCHPADRDNTSETTTSADLAEPDHITSETAASAASPEPDNIISDSFSSAPFGDIRDGDSWSDAELKALIAKIPSDKYEAYPDTHCVPVSATLYKNGEKILIDADDERLIKLTNFVNNCIHYSKCAYTQGLLPIDDIEKNVMGCDFRLELTYTPYGETGPSPYGTCTTGCDTIVITNKVTLIAHDLPGYEGRSESYPFRAVGVSPLFCRCSWLELFGF